MERRARKMSEIVKEMAGRLLRVPGEEASSEAAHVALMFANIAWNETVDMGHPREKNRRAWERIEANNPEMWSDFKSNDVDAMIDDLVEFKRQHYPDDQRRILACGMPDGKVRVEWLPPADPGVDPRWEMQVFGLVRTGQHVKAVEFLRETRDLTWHEAAVLVETLAAKLEMSLRVTESGGRRRRKSE